jgi:hypothetical protein
MAVAQPTIQFNLDNDVRTLVAMVSGMVPYIYGTELFGAMPPNMPRLTVGGILMRLHRLGAIKDSLNGEQQAALREAQAGFEKTRAAWPVAYEGKAGQELDARLKALGSLLNECTDDRRRCMEVYPSEIEKRVMAEHLAAELREQDALSAAQEAGIRGFDGAIRASVEKAPFIWDKRLEAAYPEDTYWYLYRIALPPNNR